jgi:dolichol-phosphate mannosyltransferase
MAVLVIIPCLNESKKFKTDYYNQLASRDKQLLFANNGSTDNTVTLIKNLCAKNEFCHSFHCVDKNQASELLRKSYYFAKGEGLLDQVQWLATNDTPDLGIITEEIEHLDVNFVVSKRAKIFFLKKMQLLMFHFIFKLFFNIKFSDALSPFKMIKVEEAEAIFLEPFHSKLLNLEIIIRMNKDKIYEYEFKRPQSKVSYLNPFSIFIDLIILKIKY